MKINKPLITTALIALSTAAFAEVKIGFLVTDSGPAGLFGPSTRNSALLAVEDINAAGGINGEPIELVFADAGLAPADVVQSAIKLWKRDNVMAMVGMHDSAVREAVQGQIGGKIPYVYTPVHAGGKCQEGVYITGETPNQQLEPSIPYLMKSEGVSKWYLIGHDYSWPHDTNAVAKTIINSAGGEIVGEEYLPLNASDFDSSLQKIQESGADGVLITLVGGGAVGFNIAFAGFGLDEKAIRLGTLMEENTLAGIGPDNSNRLFNAAGYFANLEHEGAAAFADKYAKTYGADAAALNGLGQSGYEGLMLLSALANAAGSFDVKAMDSVAEGITFESPRGAGLLQGRHVTQPIYLADGSSGAYKVIETFDAIQSSEKCGE